MTDPVRQRILGAIQNPLPVASRPFEILSEQLSLSEKEVMENLEALQNQGILREISAIFEGRKLGYRTALVAVATEDPDGAASFINKHPGVSHNYRRNHRFNIWFTMASPPGSDIDWEVRQLCTPFRPEAVRLLPAIKTYKLRVGFGSAPPDGMERRPDACGTAAEGISIDPRVVRALQAPWPIAREPWPLLAQREELETEYLMDQAEVYVSAGIIRRISGVVRHRKIGFAYNGMTCFLLPEEQLDPAGAILSSYREVSHCYYRKTYDDWPFNLYAMSHSKSKENAEELIRRMSVDLGSPEMITLYSDKEYKKERVRYFPQG